MYRGDEGVLRFWSEWRSKKGLGVIECEALCFVICVCVCFGVLEANVMNVLWGKERSLWFVVVLLF